MLTIYLTTLIIGGSLLLLSIFLGGDGDHGADHDFDAHFDGELDTDFDGDFDGDFGADLDGEADVGFDAAFDAWLPIASIRFWTFFAAFFGMTGTALTATSNLGMTLTLGPAIGVGYVSGVAATRILKSLSKKSVGRVLNSEDLVGTVGALTLPVAPGVAGKIRMQIGGRTVELLAESDETINAGANAIVISVLDDGSVRITPAPLLEA